MLVVVIVVVVVVVVVVRTRRRKVDVLQIWTIDRMPPPEKCILLQNVVGDVTFLMSAWIIPCGFHLSSLLLWNYLRLGLICYHVNNFSNDCGHAQTARKQNISGRDGGIMRQNPANYVSPFWGLCAKFLPIMCAIFLSMCYQFFCLKIKSLLICIIHPYNSASTCAEEIRDTKFCSCDFDVDLMTFIVNVTWPFVRCTCRLKMNFLYQSFWKLLYYLAH